MVQTQMLKEDRVMPKAYNFTILIGVLGRVGYTKLAFHLFNKVGPIMYNLSFFDFFQRLAQYSGTQSMLTLDAKYSHHFGIEVHVQLLLEYEGRQTVKTRSEKSVFIYTEMYNS